MSELSVSKSSTYELFNTLHIDLQIHFVIGPIDRHFCWWLHIINHSLSQNWRIGKVHQDICYSRYLDL